LKKGETSGESGVGLMYKTVRKNKTYDGADKIDEIILEHLSLHTSKVGSAHPGSSFLEKF
jgi:hypothetical protein